MEPLKLKHRLSTMLSLVFGVLLIFSGIFHLIDKEATLKFINWFGSIFNIVLGAAIIFSAVKSYISHISVSENYLKIKWSSSFREVKIQDMEIKMIILSKSYVEIQRQGKKASVMSIEFWRKKNKNQSL